jgi:hypothetical protein
LKTHAEFRTHRNSAWVLYCCLLYTPGDMLSRKRLRVLMVEGAGFCATWLGNDLLLAGIFASSKGHYFDCRSMECSASLDGVPITLDS